MNDNAIIRQSINMTDMAASMVAEMSGKIKRLFTEAQIKNISKVDLIYVLPFFIKSIFHHNGQLRAELSVQGSL